MIRSHSCASNAKATEGKGWGCSLKNIGFGGWLGAFVQQFSLCVELCGFDQSGVRYYRLCGLYNIYCYILLTRQLVHPKLQFFLDVPKLCPPSCKIKNVCRNSWLRCNSPEHRLHRNYFHYYPSLRPFTD